MKHNASTPAASPEASFANFDPETLRTFRDCLSRMCMAFLVHEDDPEERETHQWAYNSINDELSRLELAKG
jgi:hypothetical protein